MQTQSWYAADFLNADNKSFCRFDYAENRLYRASLENMTINSVFILPMIRNDYFAVAFSSTKRIPIVHWDGKSTFAKFVHDESGVEQEQRFQTNNLDYSTTDPFGRFVAGTYRLKGCVANQDIDGNIYVFEKNGEIVQVIPNIKTVGGLAWNREKKLVYFIDSCDYKLREYEWNPKTGTLRKDRLTNFPLIFIIFFNFLSGSSYRIFFSTYTNICSIGNGYQHPG